MGHLHVHYTHFVFHKIVQKLHLYSLCDGSRLELWRTKVCHSKFSVSLDGMWFASLASHVLVLYLVDDMPDPDCYSERICFYILLCDLQSMFLSLDVEFWSFYVSDDSNCEVISPKLL